jgi:hypothetical protein
VGRAHSCLDESGGNSVARSSATKASAIGGYRKIINRGQTQGTNQSFLRCKITVGKALAHLDVMVASEYPEIQQLVTTVLNQHGERNLRGKLPSPAIAKF